MFLDGLKEELEAGDEDGGTGPETDGDDDVDAFDQAFTGARHRSVSV